LKHKTSIDEEARATCCLEFIWSLLCTCNQ